MAGPFLIFFALFWSVIVLGFDGVMTYTTYQQYESGSFPSVTGTVTRSQVEQRTGSKGRTYYYAIVNAHPFNSPVQVYYNPKDPNESLLYPGIAGSDMFGALFLTPFNMVLIGLWMGVYAWLRERLFKPVAGGVKIIADGMTTRVRLPTVGAIWWGLGTTGLLGFAAVFAVGFGAGFQPSMATVLLAVCGIY